MLIALPTADRPRSFAFYSAGLGFPPIGTPAEDGVPEPLQFDVQGTRIMFIPTGGFGWVTGGRPTAKPDTSECLLSLTAETSEEVDEIVSKAAAAGAEVVAQPEQQPWGYVGVFADPDGHLWQVTSS